MSNVSTPRANLPAPAVHYSNEDQAAVEAHAERKMRREQKKEYKRARKDGVAKKAANARGIAVANDARDAELDAYHLIPRAEAVKTLAA